MLKQARTKRRNASQSLTPSHAGSCRSNMESLSGLTQARICALTCIPSQRVPMQYLSNALSLAILFYYLQSPQPFISNPRGFDLGWHKSKLLLLYMFVSFTAHLSPCLSVLSSVGLSCPVPVPLYVSLFSICPCPFVQPVHLSSG